jgi:prepilin-type N-terminal cleavage/methylation domain-containing protein
MTTATRQPDLAPSRARFRGFTLMELMISMAVGLVVIGVLVSLSIISAQNFAATANYVQMNDQSRLALDRISREIRNATQLVGIQTSNPQYLILTNAVLGKLTTITCNTNANVATLTLAKTGEGTETLLTGCDAFHFDIFNRYPLIVGTNLSFYPATNSVTGKLDPKFCKVISLSWKCSRTILGSKLNTEIVQTAQVVLRNQVTQ